jgi:Fe-S-cluster-containing dehydrogenase component/CRP-like cAMP-binding protein
MPREITKHSEILEAIRSVDLISELVEQHDGHFKYELELEVIVYGRNYTGKKVGPYVRLLEYGPGEDVIHEGDWAGNTFFISVAGPLDVYVKGKAAAPAKVGAIKSGTSFGEMAVLAGVPRNATIRTAEGAKAAVLEVQRPALRLLRKLPKFGRMLDVTYREHGLKRAVEEVREATGNSFSPELLKKLENGSKFSVFGKNHVIFREGQPVNRMVFIKNGWVRRARGVAFNPAMVDMFMGVDQNVAVDFLGGGNCLGLEGVSEDAQWAYSATVLSRTEVLEISIPYLRDNPQLLQAVMGTFTDFSLADDPIRIEAPSDKRVTAALAQEVATGIIDATNLLVMDMDLCIRCGNCSLACHKVHGQSRLLRRGIHIDRPVKPKSRSNQHVLAPSVCMHCQDPECLTGCPTGAIGRLPGGQIDINTKTCIGCSDCATQCPYNAISMVPRKPAAPPKIGFGGKLKSWISLAPPKEPSPVTEIENLLAVKCNLCQDTPLNPPGAKTKAYSCEQNCPTGALVRVNPREYFSEATRSIGIVFRDQTRAIGRDIHKSDPLAKLWHLLGVLATIGLTTGTVWALRRYGLDGHIAGTWWTMRWITGLVGLLGIAGVMTYPGRKQIYRHRAGALRYWLLSHVYLGVIAGIVLLLHGGSDSGGLITSLLMISFDLVILSGLFGIACYLIVPRIMTSIEGDPLLIEDLRARRDELRETLAGIDTRDSQLQQLIKGKIRKRFFSFSYLLRQYLRREPLSNLLAEAREKFEPDAARLSDPRTREQLIEAVEATATLRRVDSLIYLHQLLKLWLAPHVVSTSLMLALMFVHIIQVIFFVVR